MATITLLHWNIEQFSLNKLNSPNGPALIDFIARVIVRSDANMVSLLELKNSASRAIVAQLLPAIHLARGGVGANPWKGIGIDSGYNNEGYAVLYRNDQKFTFLLPTTGGDIPISGLSNQALLGGITPGGALRFPSRMTQSGGRKPYYAAFRTTDTNRKFTVIAYHAMFGKFSEIGVGNVGLLAQSRAVINTGTTVKMDASLIAGDFNVNFTPTDPAYQNLLTGLPSEQATNEKTSLKVVTPPEGYPTSEQYRENAYDNIFMYDREEHAVSEGAVMDLIKDSTLYPPGTGSLAPEIIAFVRGPVPFGHLIQRIPPDDFEDAWHIVRYAISDHLPVYTKVKI